MGVPIPNMTDREYIIELFGKVVFIEQQLKEIKQTLREQGPPGSSDSCKLQNATLDKLDKVVDDHELRIEKIETYIKISVTAIVIAVSVFGVYVLDAIIHS